MGLNRAAALTSIPPSRAERESVLKLVWADLFDAMGRLTLHQTVARAVRGLARWRCFRHAPELRELSIYLTLLAFRNVVQRYVNAAETRASK
jgi:hypothetical protein